MGFIGSVLLFSWLGLCLALVCCGALLLAVRVTPLVARQRAALYGVGRG